MSDQNKAMKDFGDVPMATLTMTLRDWFAGQALAGWLASYGPGDSVDFVDMNSTGRFAYGIADAMMEARK